MGLVFAYIEEHDTKFDFKIDAFLFLCSTHVQHH